MDRALLEKRTEKTPTHQTHKFEPARKHTLLPEQQRTYRVGASQASSFELRSQSTRATRHQMFRSEHVEISSVF